MSFSKSADVFLLKKAKFIRDKYSAKNKLKCNWEKQLLKNWNWIKVQDDDGISKIY